jgi:4-amino-4-deoxy-L-arabinose transferase-like glycosyltransferase
VWGILGAGVIALSWHVYVARLYPGVGGYLANLRYDFSETHEFDEPWWYYPVMLLGRAMPWIPAAIVALVVTARQAWGDPKQLLLDHGNDQTPTHRAETTGRGQGGFPRSTRGGGNSALRFLWCWAIVPIIVLSIPHRKHHHYLVPSLPPWAILAALGLKPIAELMFKGPASTRRARFGLMVVGVPLGIAIVILGWKRLLSPSGAIVSQVESGVFLAALAGGCIWLFYHGLWTKNGKWMLAAIVIGMSGVFSWEQTQLRDDYVPDTFFLRQDVAAVVPGDKLLVINAAIGPLNFFRVQFYLRGDAVLVHNLTYLRSDRIHASEAYVVGQVGDLQFLRTLGDAKMMSRSARPEKKDTPALALFHLVFSADLKRYPAPAVSVMQAMMRESGPWCGPEGGGG